MTALLSNIDRPATVVLSVICLTVGVVLTIVQARRGGESR